ncbi:response regulator transcription factor (plasmid) [Ureibacillus chungkukjangi]|uniref:response regulator transcription factor n=1 Tax=Ureibacillus chungkukjangi TaxID=1202712 RepID=UPI000D3D3B16|nr:response regulator transcription factor [Ureibacillus chungkukjangi]MCM3390685.1 response regulator transcription factor [Ureibacillus chungkukjangi]
MQTILLVDDEQRMLDLVELFLSPHGYKCIKETSGIEALQTLKKEPVDLVLLDVMMPGMDGWEVCEAIREFSSIPIIMLTARMEKGDLVKGLNMGADDYITKPFDERELIARVNALLRRTSEISNTLITFNDFTLDTEMYSFQYKDQTVPLTMKEFYIIKALISRPTKAYTREELLQVAWEYESDIEIRAVDSHIRNLREKLRKAGFSTDEFLNTVWGIGYRWS